jgi:hypothetical protein
MCYIMIKAGPEGYMAENIPVYYAYSGIYTGILGEKGYMGVFRGARNNFQGLGGGTLIRMLCNRFHSTDDFIAHVLVKILRTYIELLLKCILGHTVNTLAVAGWAGPLPPSEPDIFPVTSTLAKLGCAA